MILGIQPLVFGSVFLTLGVANFCHKNFTQFGTLHMWHVFLFFVGKIPNKKCFIQMVCGVKELEPTSAFQVTTSPILGFWMGLVMHSGTACRTTSGLKAETSEMETKLEQREPNPVDIPLYWFLLGILIMAYYNPHITG